MFLLLTYSLILVSLAEQGDTSKQKPFFPIGKARKQGEMSPFSRLLDLLKQIEGNHNTQKAENGHFLWELSSSPLDLQSVQRKPEILCPGQIWQRLANIWWFVVPCLGQLAMKSGSTLLFPPSTGRTQISLPIPNLSIWAATQTSSQVGEFKAMKYFNRQNLLCSENTSVCLQSILKWTPFSYHHSIATKWQSQIST